MAASFDSGLGGLITILLIAPCFLVLHQVALPLTKWINQDVMSYIESRNKVLHWRNIVVSYIHAFVSSLWIFHLWSVVNKDVWEEMIYTDSPECRLLLCFSTGYFVADTIDMFFTNQLGWQLAAHHILGIIASCLAIYQSMCAPYLVTALSVEVCNTLLHQRKLMLLAGVNKDSRRYSLNLVAVLVSFIWRFWVNFYLLIRVVGDYHIFPYNWNFAIVGMIGLNLLNCSLLYAVVRSDNRQLRALPKFLDGQYIGYGKKSINQKQLCEAVSSSINPLSVRQRVSR